MFTVGLFSTHLPYVAFVLFYAVFFFFGIEKVSAGESQEGEQFITNEISFTIVKEGDADNGYFFADDACRKEVINILSACYSWNSKLTDSVNPLIRSAVYLFSCFSRPPPVASVVLNKI